MRTISAAWNGLLRLLLFTVVTGFLSLAANAYYGEHTHTRAEAGRKTLTDYHTLLREAYSANPYNDKAALRYAQFLQARGSHSASLQVLHRSHVTTSHWQAWELQAVALGNSAFEETTNEAAAAEAHRLFGKVLRVHPAYEAGLERHSLLALQMGEWNVVEENAKQLLALNASNGNATYFRARVAEAMGNAEQALSAYQQLSARGLAAGWIPLYSKQELAEKLSSEPGILPQ